MSEVKVKMEKPTEKENRNRGLRMAEFLEREFVEHNRHTRNIGGVISQLKPGFWER